MEATFTSAELEDAALNGAGPFFSWLQRVQEYGGDSHLRRFALELLRSSASSNARIPQELVDQLAAFIEDPARGSLALRPWMASDGWIWREIAKLAFEWGGAHRTGDSLVRQVAIVTNSHLLGRNPEPALRAACERLPRLHDEPGQRAMGSLATKSKT